MSLTFVQIGLMINDFVSFASPNCIVLIQSSKFGNDILWLFMRSLGYQIWAVPIIYVFWPEKGIRLKESYRMITDEVTNTDTSINTDNVLDMTPMVMNRYPTT